MLKRKFGYGELSLLERTYPGLFVFLSLWLNFHLTTFKYLIGNFSAVECFSIPMSGFALNAAQPQYSIKGFRRKPVFIPLRLKIPNQQIDFSIACFFIKIYKEIWCSKISIIFGDFILKNKMIPPGVPC